MGFVKYQKSKAQPHQHVFVRQGDREVCVCGASRPTGGS
jgi:hypothetical protein